MANSNSIRRFQEAMRHVYGPVDGMRVDDAKGWVPPDKPGAGGHRGRYLWTDAFGVVNFITLYKETQNETYLELSKSLVKRVHEVLGRTRDGKQRLRGATDEESLKGGLRIGKVDETGSDCDGQYHHYLTLWMFALNRLSLVCHDEQYNSLAVQLAEAIHPHFVKRTSSGMFTMVWKVSTDLVDVLVPSEGHLDAATGYVVCRLLQLTHQTFHPGKEAMLAKEITEYDRVMHREGKKGLRASADVLDLGMGLWMCHFFKSEAWAAKLGSESLENAKIVLAPEFGVPSRPASRRLAFREFGSCLGVRCYGPDAELEEMVSKLVHFWEDQMVSSTMSDQELRPISMVMYAAAIIPGGFRDGYVS